MQLNRYRLRYIIAFLAVLTCVVAWPYLETERRYRETLSDLEARGFATTWEGLEEVYPYPPDDENGALVYAQATNAFVHTGLLKDSPSSAELYKVLHHDIWTPIPEATMTDIENAITPNAKSLKLLREAMAFERSRYPFVRQKRDDPLPQHRLGLLNSGQLLSLLAMFEAERGNALAAAGALAALLRVGESLREDPTLSTTRLGIFSTSFNVLEQAVNRTEWTEEALANIDQAIQGIDIRATARAWHQALALFIILNDDTIPDYDPFYGRRTTGTSLQQALLDQFERLLGGSRRPPSPPPRPRRWTKKDKRHALMGVARLAKAAAKPYAQASADSLEISEEFAGASRRASLSSIIVPQLANRIKVEARAMAELRIMEAVVAVERHRVATGELPVALDRVAPEFMSAMPIDPFDGQAIRCARKDNGYVLYSIGDNLIDDGGIKGTGRSRLDIVFEVRR